MIMIYVGIFLGDEVVEWNARSLQGSTFEEVYDIISESKNESQIELIVHRPFRYTSFMSHSPKN